MIKVITDTTYDIFSKLKNTDMIASKLIENKLPLIEIPFGWFYPEKKTGKNPSLQSDCYSLTNPTTTVKAQAVMPISAQL